MRADINADTDMKSWLMADTGLDGPAASMDFMQTGMKTLWEETTLALVQAFKEDWYLLAYTAFTEREKALDQLGNPDFAAVDACGAAHSAHHYGAALSRSETHHSSQESNSIFAVEGK